MGIQKEIAAYVREELTMNERSTLEALTDRFQAPINTVKVALYRHLSREEKEKRKKLLKGEWPDESAIVETIRQELKAFPETGIMTPTQELASRFSTSPTMISKLIKRNLKEPLRRRRTIALRQQIAEKNFNGITEEEHSERYHKGYRRGVGSLDIEERSQAGRKGMLAIIHRNTTVNGMKYDSISEAACALALTQYIPGFKVERGVNYQVRTGRYKIDFQLSVLGGQRLFLEWHPIKLMPIEDGGDFNDDEEYELFQEELFETDISLGDEIRRRWSKRLATAYLDERRSLIETDIEHAGTDLVHAHDEESLYDGVLQPYGRYVPPKTFFKGEFRDWIQQIKNRKETILLIDQDNVRSQDMPNTNSW